MANWWQGKVSQAFNPPVEPGQDIALSVGTPVTALEAGSIVSEVYGPFGGRVDVNVGGSSVIYYQHLDEIAPGLQVGSHVTAGQALGDSGGQLSGGQHPNSPLNSSGPHIEVGETVGGKPVNPASLIAAGPQQQQPQALNTAATGNLNLGGLAAWLSGLGLNLALPGVDTSGVQSTVQGAIGQGTNGLVNVSVPDPISSLRDWVDNGLTQAKGQVGGQPGFWSDNIIPLVVAVIIVLVVLGTGSKQTQTQTQVIPVPV